MSDTSSFLEHRIPPPIVGLFCGALMWLASRMVPVARFGLPGHKPLAVAVALAGILTAALGVRLFRGKATTLNPMTPEAASSLVVGGIFNHTRNPMYLGMALLLLGWATWLANAAAFLLIAGFILYMNRFQIAPEERALTQIFGAEYAAYTARVRRWL